MGDDLFLLGRQASLDLESFPRVLVGVPYDKWMKAAEWNAWLDGADWTAHFDKTAVDALHMDPVDADGDPHAAGGRPGHGRRGARPAHPRREPRLPVRPR